MSGLGSRKGGGIFTPVKTPQERVLDTISILHKGAKTEDMGEESALEGRLGSCSVTVQRVYVESGGGRDRCWQKGQVPAWSQDRGLGGCLLSGASPGGHVGPLQSE